MAKAVEVIGQDKVQLTPAQEQVKLNAAREGFRAAITSFNNAVKSGDTKRIKAAQAALVQAEQKATFAGAVASASAVLEMNKIKADATKTAEQATANLAAAKQELVGAQANQAGAAATREQTKIDLTAAQKASQETKTQNADAAAKAASVKAEAQKAAEAARLKAEADAKAKAAADAAAKDAQIADTSAKLADSERARIAAEAQATAAEAASAKAVAEAKASINKSGDVAIPTVSVADKASEMYAKELADKAANEKILLERKSVSEIMTERFKKYGLESLVPAVRNLAIEGANEATITLALQETPEYKTRFKANEARIKAGLQVLSPSEYLQNEDAYRRTLRENGLTEYDTDKYVSKFIEVDTSPEELSGRIALANNRIKDADPTVIKTLKDFGLTDTDLLGYVLDTKNKLPEITRKIQTAEIGAAARAQGLNLGTTAERIAQYQTTAESLAKQGIDQAAAQKGYSAIASYLLEAEKLSSIYSNMEGYGQTQAEQEVFGKLASAQRAREALRAQEVATFSGSTGTMKGSLAQKATGLI